MNVAGRRILIVLPSLGNLGGAERQGILLAGLLKQAGATVEVWGKEQPGEVARQVGVLGLAARHVEMDLRVRLLRLWLNLRAFRKQVRQGRFDWIVPFTTGPNIFCAMTWRGAGARACIWNQRDEGQRLGIKPVDFKAIERAPVLASNSTHAARMLQERFGVDAARTRVVHNGVALDPPRRTRELWRKELEIGPYAPVALMLANITPRKDHATLITAWQQVVRPERDAVLILAGGHGESIAARRAQAEQLGLGARVLFPGSVGDVSGLVAASDLGVFSSRMEGCPNGVLECMAGGLAVVGTDIPGIREALGDDAAPLLAPEGDADGLAQRIITLLQDSVLRHREGMRNRARIAAEFSPQRMAEGMVAALTDAERAAP